MKTLTLKSIDAEVLQASFKAPILVLFWAKRVSESQNLLKLLEKIEPDLTITAATANLEEMPQIAQYFGVSALPSLKIIHQGQIIADFNGTMDEPQLRHFLKDYVKSDAHAEIQNAIAAGDFAKAQALAESALLNDSKNEVILLDLAEIFLAQQSVENAEALLNQSFTGESARAESLKKRLALLKNAPNLADLEKEIAANPDNLDLRLNLARALAAAGKLEEALNAALFVLEKDKTNDAAKKTLLELFAALEGDVFEDLIRQKRRQMSRILN